MRKYPFSFSLMCVVVFLSLGVVVWVTFTLRYRTEMPLTSIASGQNNPQVFLRVISKEVSEYDSKSESRALLNVLRFEFSLYYYNIGVATLLKELERNNLTLEDIDSSEEELEQLHKNVATINAIYLLDYIRGGGYSRANILFLEAILREGNLEPQDIGSSFQEINWMYCNPANECMNV